MTDTPTTQRPMSQDDDPRTGTTAELGPPTIVVDDLHVTYRVLATGKRHQGQPRRSLLKRRIPTRGMREINAVTGVSFVAHEGEAIGLIGTNGSGKSTLLRAIAGLLPATRGRVWADGHPTLLGVNAALINELSGERNIVLGGLALGMSPQEVRAKYDDVADFAGIGDFLELPMLTYSSGMAARLRFAIASSVQHRILLIDEALATGDAVFRGRSEQRIRELREEAGTVFLVSHSLDTVVNTCDRAMWLDRGVLRMDGDAGPVIEAYREASAEAAAQAAADRRRRRREASG
jgi:teichoic acid transport system ATP-binding protein